MRLGCTCGKTRRIRHVGEFTMTRWVEWIKDTALFIAVMVEVLWYWNKCRSDWYSKGRVAK